MEVLRVGYQIPFDRRPPLSERPLSLPAYSPQSIKGVTLNQEFQNILQKGAVNQSPPVSWFLQPSVPRPEGFGVVASHHRTVDPERLRHLVSLPHGNSTVSPSLHPSRRLDDFPGPAGRLPAGSCSSRFASLPSIRGARTDIPVQGPLFRSDDCAPSFHEDYGSGFPHPSQVWGQDASFPGRLAHPGLFGGVPVYPVSPRVPLASDSRPPVVPHAPCPRRNAPDEVAPDLPPGPVGFSGRSVSDLLVPSLSG